MPKSAGAETFSRPPGISHGGLPIRDEPAYVLFGALRQVVLDLRAIRRLAIRAHAITAPPSPEGKSTATIMACGNSRVDAINSRFGPWASLSIRARVVHHIDLAALAQHKT